MGPLSEERTPRDFDEAFEDIVDDPKQNPIVFFGDENVEDLGPPIAEGGTLHEAVEAYRKEREQYE
jgi:hypothetical protein